MSVWSELRRRNIFKVAAAYVIVAWLVIEVASIVLPTFQTPPWVMQALVFLLVLGLPVALVLAWALELTPEGVRWQADVDQSSGTVRRSGQRLNRIVIGGLLLALGFVLLDAYVLSDSEQERAEPVSSAQTRQRYENSVAILPFENLSPNPDNAYFADGIHEMIIGELANIEDIIVIASRTMQRFRGTAHSIGEIADELNVETVMAGTVQYANDAVRITTQLIDPDNDQPLWSQIYDRDFDDIFAIQTDIATQIALALEAELTPAERRGLEAPMSSSPAAYAAYLRALTHVLDIEPGNTPEQVDTMFAHLDEALALDENFAQALALRSFLYAMSAIQATRLNDPLSREERLERAEEFARQALEKDPTTGLAYTSIGYRDTTRSRFAAAVPAFERAYELNPSDPDVIQEIALNYALLGRADRARELIDELLIVNPDDLFFEGFVELKLGDIDSVIAAYEAALRLNPLDVATIVWLGVVEAGQGAAESAIGRFRLAEQLAPEISPTYLTYLAYGYGLAGAADDAMRLFQRIKAASQEYSIGPGNLAMAHLAIGDEERTLELLAVQVDNPGPAEGVMSLWSLWLNEFEDQRLEQPEFREMRSRFRFRE